MAIDYSALAQPKPEPRKRTKARKDRLERFVERLVRDKVAERDGYCRVSKDGMVQCQGPSEWAHYGERRRFKTVGMDPTERHQRKWSLMLCKKHHMAYDAHELKITADSDLLCDGDLSYEWSD